ncbi:hypothetical protein E3N88_20270 [Mikania micrantha]|uniref:Uncharacterized protein n=1 Tax=Mikania micrantha TaxID=192012 RepID=A0A5N6NIZ0_9ASTR|nr:hypothetical protein E3N88_20270 [Mikania micrantha]
MTFEVGAALEDAKWQVPWYCFEHVVSPATMADVNGAITHRGLLNLLVLLYLSALWRGDWRRRSNRKHHNSSNHRPLRHIALASETSPEVRHGSSKEKRTKTTIIVTAFGGDRREIPA